MKEPRLTTRVNRPEPAGRPTLLIESIAWKRIQCTLRGRPMPAASIDPRAIRLREPSGHHRLVPPAHGESDGTALSVRFNPMQGPDGVPLPAGRWEVVVWEAPGRAHPIRIANPEALAGDDQSASFSMGRRGIYVITPVAGRPHGHLAFDVRLDPPASPLARDGDTRVYGFDVEGEPTSDAEAPPAPMLADRIRARAVTLARRASGALRRSGFQLAFGIFRLAARRNGRRILFTSDSRGQLGGNLRLVHDRMVERGLDRDYELLTLFKPGIRASRGWQNRLRLAWCLSRADVVLLDDYQPAIYRLPDRNLKIIQLWHAYGSFKTVGYSRVGKPGGPSPWSRDHKNYTYAIVGSHLDVPHYAEAFGIPESRVIPTGVPRMDDFVASARDPARRERVYEAIPEARGRWTMLFAPTFRGHGAQSAYYDLKLLDLAAIHGLCLEKDAVFVIRLHPFVHEQPNIPPEFRDRLIDGSARAVETNDLLLVVDLLITDYSSIVFEGSMLRRSMLFFAYDLDEYMSSRDFYVPYEEWAPGKIVRDFPELLEAIRRGDFEADKVDAFIERNFDHLEGGAADRIIDQLILAG